MEIREKMAGRIECRGAWAGLSLRLGITSPLLFAFIFSPPVRAEPVAQHNAKAAASQAAKSPFSEAEELFRRGSTEEARNKTLEALKLHPASVEGYNLLGFIYARENKFEPAIEAFQHALKLDPKSTRSHINLGNIYVAQEKFELAEKQFRAALAREPANRDANYNLGLVLLARGQPSEAVGFFQKVHPADTPALFNLVRAYLRSGRTSEGLKLSAELSAQGEGDVRLHFTLGGLLGSEKQYEAGQQELEKANSLQPGTFEILYNLGQSYLRTSDYTKAELVLQRAIKIRPDSAEALALLAQAYSEQKRVVDALELLVRARKLAPQNTDVIFLMARLSMSQRYFEDAIPLLEEGLKIAPKRADLRAALGESFFMTGKVEKAIEEFKTLIEIDPSARSYAFMGLSYRNLGRFDEAKKYLEEGLKQDPRNASCLFNLGYIANRQGNYAEAEKLFEDALQSNPDYSEALLELASVRINSKRFEEAAELLRKFVRVSHDPAPGYYKLAMVERSLHQMDAAQRDMKVFQTLSKDSSSGPYPYQHLFDYLNNRASLPAEQQTQLDLAELIDQTHKHPDQPQNLFMLAETYLKLGQVQEAMQTVSKLDELSSGDFRTQTGIGVLLARYHLFKDAIQHFQSALQSNPGSDDVKFDLANAYFQTGAFTQALDTAQRISTDGRKDDSVLALLGDIYAHLGRLSEAVQIFSDAIQRNPDNDQYYLSLALAELRSGNLAAADETLHKGLQRIPDSGRILWGIGVVAALDGKAGQAEENLQRAVDLLPEWPGSYSVLGVFYYQTGQIAKAREVLDRFTQKNPNGGLDVNRIEKTLAQAPESASSEPVPLSSDGRRQILQVALSLADRTL
jgi:tetratricopeptide (TPR) repeat protein